MPTHARRPSLSEKQSPPHKEHASPDLQYRFRPGLDRAVREYAEGQQGADADSGCFHRGAPASRVTATSAASSIHAVPRILFASLSLRARLRTICNTLVSGPV